MPTEKKKTESEEPQYAAEQYAVNDYEVPADYTVPYTAEGTDYTETSDYTQQQQAYDYSDPNAQYYDPNQYYYDYTTGTYIDATAASTSAAAASVDPSAAYNYDQYYSQQAYYDPSYYAGDGTVTNSGAALPESVTAIQSAATASSKYANTSTSTYNTPASQAPKVYYPSTANSNNPIGPIIITKSGYSGPTASTSDGTSGTNTKKKVKKVVRAAGGEVWEDHSLEDWDDNDFRLFAGDLGNEVTEEILYKAFSKYPSLLRTRVVRDTRTMKSKGFGFISFKDPDDFVKAWREMNGKNIDSIKPFTKKKLI